MSLSARFPGSDHDWSSHYEGNNQGEVPTMWRALCLQIPNQILDLENM